MKIYLDKEYLQKITKGKHELCLSEEQKQEMERIEGMLEQDIRFCGLVTGYRGTGKSSFVKYMLKKFQNNNVLVVSFNAAKYQNFDTFIRRFVRELYFQMKKRGGVSEQLRKMYYHTFFDIKQTYTNNSHEQECENEEMVSAEETQITSSMDVMKLLKITLYVVLISSVCSVKESAVFKVIFVVFFILFIIMDLKLHKQWKLSKLDIKKREELIEKRQSKFAETLYDKEIAEYYIYDELQDIDDNGNNMIFVLDELDKVDNQEINMIFHDLKPLFLSGNCNFILIAGRNMERYLFDSQKDSDSVAATIFTHKLYVPLSTIQDMREFAEYFYKVEEHQNRKKEFYSDDNAQKYFNMKIYEARGVKRAFVNGVLSDLRWENGKPYVDLLSKDISDEFLSLFTILERMQEKVYESYDGPKRDELLQNIYIWISKIQQNRHTIFSLTDIVGDRESIIKEAIYSNETEQTNLVYELLEELVKEKILKENKEGYKWNSEIAIKTESSTGEENEETNIRMKECVQVFQEQWDEMAKILSCFAKYNNIEIKSDVVKSKPEEYELLYNGMKSDFSNEPIDKEFKDKLDYLYKLYDHGIEENDIENMQMDSRDMTRIKAMLVEKLLRYTFQHSEEFKMWKSEMEEKDYAVNRFDGIYYDNMYKRRVYVDVKYYKTYMSITNSGMMSKLMEAYSRWVPNNQESFIKIIVFTDSASEFGMSRFKNKCKDVLKQFGERGNLDIVLVPLNDYKMFERQMGKIHQIDIDEDSEMNKMSNM